MATLTPLLRLLQDRGYLTRRTDARNRRRKLLKLTEEGAVLVKRVRVLAAQTEERMLANCSSEQRQNLVTILSVVARLREGENGAQADF
jgi:DNA-binding MarR family transcriptional regulator